MGNEEKNKQQEIQEAREYAECIINAVREPLVVLDQDLKIISVSNSFYDIFKVKPEETIGKLIYDVGNRQWDVSKLRELLETILPKSASFDNFEIEHDFPGLGKRIMLLNARKIPRPSGKPNIILLAIEDITEAKKILDGLREEIRRLEALQRAASTREHTMMELKRKVDELERRVLRRHS
ncbi:MAG: PAS domain-containing protein [Candidatus Omnitrophica bacterium]|jgi:PAS domain S-box-containing protein|nr:PAS domain-containing protein [Candidatus Omnitrophota bacterium]